MLNLLHTLLAMLPDPPVRRNQKAAPDTIYVLDEKVRRYRRPRSRFWQCATFIGGRDLHSIHGQYRVAA